MKIRTSLGMASFLAEDGVCLLQQIVASRPELSTPPKRLSINWETVPTTGGWLEEGVASGRHVQANWFPDVHPSPALLTADPRAGAAGLQLRTEWSISCVAKYVRSVGAWLAVFGDLFESRDCWKPHKRPGDGGRELFGFAQTVAPGWGCMFVGDRGHAQLVSRRWLDHGPWLLHRFADDISLIQFHDLDADPATALAQALPGHCRLGDNDTGGWLRSRYTPKYETKGLYVASDQTLRIVVAPGRVISEREMLDACAERLVGRYNAEKPIRVVRYAFIDPDDAQRHLHEMWLRDLEVWTFTSNGKEIRIDDTYDPSPTPPEWVRRLRKAEEKGA